MARRIPGPWCTLRPPGRHRQRRGSGRLFVQSLFDDLGWRSTDRVVLVQERPRSPGRIVVHVAGRSAWSCNLAFVERAMLVPVGARLRSWACLEVKRSVASDPRIHTEMGAGRGGPAVVHCSTVRPSPVVDDCLAVTVPGRRVQSGFPPVGVRRGPEYGSAVVSPCPAPSADTAPARGAIGGGSGADRPWFRPTELRSAPSSDPAGPPFARGRFHREAPDIYLIKALKRYGTALISRLSNSSLGR